jgi:hypothetical protein
MVSGAALVVIVASVAFAHASIAGIPDWEVHIPINRHLDGATPSQLPEASTGGDSDALPRKASSTNVNSTLMLVCVIAGVAIALASTAAVVKCVCLAHVGREQRNPEYNAATEGGLDNFNACAISEYDEHESVSRQSRRGSGGGQDTVVDVGRSSTASTAPKTPTTPLQTLSTQFSSTASSAGAPLAQIRAKAKRQSLVLPFFDARGDIAAEADAMKSSVVEPHQSPILKLVSISPRQRRRSSAKSGGPLHAGLAEIRAQRRRFSHAASVVYGSQDEEAMVSVQPFAHSHHDPGRRPEGIPEGGWEEAKV